MSADISVLCRLTHWQYVSGVLTDASADVSVGSDSLPLLSQSNVSNDNSLVSPASQRGREICV